ncbi:MAG: FkbM family methyltransferase [Methylobacterium mesophilicum]|nr:FkbM family methyltransferase [Methylobacterium mesophilicum]
MQPSARDIVIDAGTGSVSGANTRERTAIGLLRSAMIVLQPMNDLGFSYVARGVRKALPSSKRMIYVLGDDSRMRTDFCDAYWSVLTKPNYPYETAIRRLIADARDVAYGFIDGGANHGFWSIIVSGPEGGRKPAVAVEAASDTFEHLEDNRRLNGGRFTALNRAIGARSGERVRIFGFKHEARSTVQPSADAKPILDCETITLDDVAAMPEFAGLTKFIVKLDVEGVEVAAFSGAERLLAGDTVFVYEEHGSDPNHGNTRHVLDALKLRVFWLGEGGVREITDVAQVTPIKKSRRFGYDLIATRSRFWIDRFERLLDKKPSTA